MPLQDERPFRQEAPSQAIFEFDLHTQAAQVRRPFPRPALIPYGDAYSGQAMAACEWDDRLSQLRYRLVPTECVLPRTAPSLPPLEGEGCRRSASPTAPTPAWR